MKRDYDELLSAGQKAQLEKLKENDHKSGFDEIDIPQSFHRIKDEYIELGEELFYEKQGCSFFEYKFKKDIDFEAVRKEAADVANFAYMIILQCDKELSNG